MTDKRDIRRKARAARDAFVHDGGAVLPVPDAFRVRLRAGRVVAAYVPIGSEADPAPFVAAAFRAGCVLALPHVTGRAAPLRFVAWDGVTLTEGPYGLRQPPADGIAVMPDIILTPLVAFDAALNRVGQGAGHYDRAFAEHDAAWRVGVAYEVQRVAGFEPDPWDLPLHAVATERNWRVR